MIWVRCGTTMKIYWCVLLLLLVSVSATAMSEDSVEQLVRAGHWKRARAALQNDPASDARTVYLRARIEYAFGDYGAALPLAEQAVRMSLADADAHLLLGQVNGRIATTAHLLRQISLVKIVKKEFDIAYSLAPENVDVLTALVEFHLRAPGIVGGDKRKAVGFADALTKVNASRGCLAEALIARHKKDFAEVAQQYAKAAESGDDYLSIVTAAEFFVSSDDAIARRYASHAIVLDPSRALAYAVLAKVLAHQANWPELDAVLADSERLVPDDLSPMFRAAEAIFQDGRQLDRAVKYVRHYLEQEPEGGCPTLAAAHTLLEQLLAKRRRETLWHTGQPSPFFEGL